MSSNIFFPHLNGPPCRSLECVHGSPLTEPMILMNYPFFGVQTAVSGVAYNIALAMTTLGDDVELLSMTGEVAKKAV